MFEIWENYWCGIVFLLGSILTIILLIAAIKITLSELFNSPNISEKGDDHV